MVFFQSFENFLGRMCTRSRFFTEKNWQYLCVASGGLCALTFFLSFIAADFLPPVHPSWDAARVHKHYFDHKTGVQAGAALMLFSGGFYLPFSAVISQQLRQIPGVSNIVCELQLASSAAGIFSFIIPAQILSLITFRDYGPEMTLFISDFFWLSAIMQWVTFWMQSWSIAWVIFADNSPNPVFPKTMALMNFISPLIFSSVSGIHTVYRGPYAWNGALAFWVPMVFFGGQFAVDTYCLVKNIRAMPDEEPTDAVSIPLGADTPKTVGSGDTA